MRLLSTATSVTNITFVKNAKGADRVKISGEDAANAVKTWAMREVSDLGTRSHDIGKFFFTVSSASAAVIVAISRLQDARDDLFLALSLIFLGLSLFAAIYIVFPRSWEIDEVVDLSAEHKAKVEALKTQSWCWFILCLVGISLGVLAVTV